MRHAQGRREKAHPPSPVRIRPSPFSVDSFFSQHSSFLVRRLSARRPPHGPPRTPRLAPRTSHREEAPRGVKERRDREHEAKRRAILAAARELFLKEGYENASIRKIALRIDYSPPAIYRYFTSKQDIFFALAEQGFHLFHRAMAAIEPSSDPVETLRRYFWRYYEFSKAQPEYFSLMFVDRTVPRIAQEWDRLAFMRAMRDQLREVIAQCVRAGLFPAGTNPDVVFHIVATAIHGAAVVRLSDRFVPRQTADALARDVLEAAIAGLRQGVPITFDADICFHSAGAPSRGTLGLGPSAWGGARSPKDQGPGSTARTVRRVRRI